MLHREADVDDSVYLSIFSSILRSKLNSQKHIATPYCVCGEAEICESTICLRVPTSLHKVIRRLS